MQKRQLAYCSFRKTKAKTSSRKKKVVDTAQKQAYNHIAVQYTKGGVKMKGRPQNNKKQVQKEVAVQAATEPLSRRDKLLRTVIIGFVAVLIGALVFFGVRFGVFLNNMSDVSKTVKNTLAAKSADFDIVLSSGNSKTELSGAYEVNTDDNTLKSVCIMDFGDRAVTLAINTHENTADMSIESEIDTDFLSVDISGIRYLLGADNAQLDLEGLLDDLSDDETDLSKYYDMSKVDSALRALRDDLSSPLALSEIFDCSVDKNTYTLTLDTYDLLMTAAESMRPIFVNEDFHKSLVRTIEDEKDSLKQQPVSIVIIKEASMISSLEISMDYSGTPVTLSVKLANTGNASVESAPRINTELCDEVSFAAAYYRIQRSGLDTEAAYKEATRSLNAFAEAFSYDVKEGTIVIIYDEHNNDFRFAYNGYVLSEISYGDALYSAWSDGGYARLNTENLDSGKYTVYMYEPQSTSHSEAYEESYNYAYLDVMQALSAIQSAGYNMTENAIFVVIESDTEFQFIYQGGNIYDVLEQYYYYVDTSYGKADISNISGIPENVTLYIPNTSDK